MTQIKVPPSITFAGCYIAQVMSCVKPVDRNVGMVSIVLKSDKAMVTKDFQLPEQRSMLAGIVARSGLFLDIDVLDRPWDCVLDDIIADGRAVPIPEAFFE